MKVGSLFQIIFIYTTFDVQSRLSSCTLYYYIEETSSIGVLFINTEKNKIKWTVHSFKCFSMTQHSMFNLDLFLPPLNKKLLWKKLRHKNLKVLEFFSQKTENWKVFQDSIFDSTLRLKLVNIIFEFKFFLLFGYVCIVQCFF